MCVCAAHRKSEEERLLRIFVMRLKASRGWCCDGSVRAMCLGNYDLPRSYMEKDFFILNGSAKSRIVVII